MPQSLVVRSRIRWSTIAGAALVLVLGAFLAGRPAGPVPSGPDAGPSGPPVSPRLATLAAERPNARVEAIVQLAPGTSAAAGRALVRAAGGVTTGRIRVLNGLAARMEAGTAYALAGRQGVRAVSLNAPLRPEATHLGSGTAYVQAVRAQHAWRSATGDGVGVAVIDTGVAGDHADFRLSENDSNSRVIASAVVHPDATGAGDGYGHGTHVAGIVAGDGSSRPDGDPLQGDYSGIAPDSDLVSVKISDEAGNATVLDAIYGLEFVIEHQDALGIRVVNLSFESTQAQSYRTDPLAAAAEAAWHSGLVVVAAAGNRGTADDAVGRAPGNDPFVISVGALDDKGTKRPVDDGAAQWSSRGKTQDGYAKPEVAAPGARIVSTLAAGSEFSRMCPTCIVDGEYIRAGGTSMAAPVVSGIAALMLEERPELTPDQVKGALIASAKTVSGMRVVQADDALHADGTANQGIEPSDLIDPATGAVDETRSRWSRSRWSVASGDLSAGWARSSWSCACWDEESAGTADEADDTRSRWSRSRWSRSRWSTSWQTSFVK